MQQQVATVCQELCRYLHLDSASAYFWTLLTVAKQYNLETIVAIVRAAERKRSPAQILLFPWAMSYAGGLLVNLAADACKSASVPISLHLDHAQDEASIKRAASMPFDSIMVDMSHYEREENLQRTAELVRYCHEKGIATEAEPGRINGGEDGVQGTGDLEEMLTTPEEAMQFVDTGIDFLAPAFGNVHGRYGGVEKIALDLPRLVIQMDFCKGLHTELRQGWTAFASVPKTRLCWSCMGRTSSPPRFCEVASRGE